MPAIWLPDEVPETLFTWMSPVEYSSGEPEPAVLSVASAREIDPPPRSVATMALWPPCVSAVILFANIVPP